VAERRGPVQSVLRPDGRRERFDPARLAASIHRAALSIGQGEELLAEELAALVSMVLEEELAGGVPTTRAVRETAERVLMETGHHDVARAYILRRADPAAGDRLPPLRAPAGEPAVRVASLGRESLEPFDASQIAGGLMVDCGLPSAESSAIAAAVETRVRALDGAIVATATVRQLVACELLERGRADLLPRVQGLGVPVNEVEAIAFAGGGMRAPERIGGELLRRFTLARLLDPAVAAAHLSGDLHVDGLCAPGEALAATIDFGEVRRAAWPGALAALLQLVHGLEPALHGPLVLQHVERALAPALEDADRAKEAARSVLLALSQGRASPSRHGVPRRMVSVGADLPAATAAAYFRRGGEPDAIRARARAFVSELLEQSVALATHIEPPRVRLLVDPGDEERQLIRFSAALPPALALGLAEVGHETGTTPAVRVVGARVGLNVARLGLAAGRRKERELLRAARELVERGLSGGANVLRHLLQRDELGVGFLRRVRDLARELARALPLELPGSHAYHVILVPVGVDAAVRAVTERDPGESESAARLRGELVAALDDALPTAATGATRFELSEEAFPDAELRFGRLDWIAFPRGRDILGLAHDGAAFRYSFDPAPPAMAMAAAVAGSSVRVPRSSADVEAP